MLQRLYTNYHSTVHTCNTSYAYKRPRVFISKLIPVLVPVFRILFQSFLDGFYERLRCVLTRPETCIGIGKKAFYSSREVTLLAT